MFDVSDVPFFDLSLLFPFCLCLCACFSLCFCACLCLCACSCLCLCLSLCTHFLSSSCSCSLVALSLTYLHHSGSCGLCASIAALIVSKFCASCCRTGHFTLFQGLTSASRERSLLRLHQHRSMSTSVRRLPLFQKWSRDFESIRWIAQFRDHLECTIFRVHHQHERKLLHSFLSNIARSRQGQFSQQIRFHICEFRTELVINRKRLRLVSNPEVNWSFPLYSWAYWGTGVRAAPASSITICRYISWPC